MTDNENTTQPSLVFMWEDGRIMMTINQDGTVTGEIEDASDAARAFLASIRKELAKILDRPPVYLAADLWDALGAPRSDFDAYFGRNGWGNTWPNLLGTVRDRFQPKCGEPVEGEKCGLTAGHLPPHYGPSDTGSSEPVPVAEAPAPQGEPSDAQLKAAAEAFSLAPFSDDEDGVLAPLRAALRAAGSVR